VKLYKGKTWTKKLSKWIFVFTYLLLGIVILVPGFLFEEFYFFKTSAIGILQPIFAIAWVVFFMYNLRWLFRELHKYILRRKYLKGIKTILKELDEKERAVLREFHFRNRSIIHVPFDDEVIKSLCMKGILIPTPKLAKVEGLQGELQPVFLNTKIKIKMNRRVLGIKLFMDQGRKKSFINANRPHWVYTNDRLEDLFN